MTQYLTVKQVADMLSIDQVGVRTHIQKGHIPATRFGDVWAILAADAIHFKQTRRGVGRPKKAAQQ